MFQKSDYLVARGAAKPLSRKEKKGEPYGSPVQIKLCSQLEDKLQRELNVPSAEPRPLYELVRRKIGSFTSHE